MHPADTDLTPVDLGSYSSRVTLMCGNAAIQAATAAARRASSRAVAAEAGGRAGARWRSASAGSAWPTTWDEAVPFAEAVELGEAHARRARVPRLLRAAQARRQVQGRRRRAVAVLLATRPAWSS